MEKAGEIALYHDIFSNITTNRTNIKSKHE